MTDVTFQEISLKDPAAWVWSRFVPSPSPPQNVVNLSKFFRVSIYVDPDYDVT